MIKIYQNLPCEATMDVFETESPAFKGFCVLLQKHALIFLNLAFYICPSYNNN